jgi:5-methyltetrahydropteroyltriglutamate--homocysteine methyltransferase
MFETTIAGSLPKPSWLAEPNKLWPQWKLAGDDLAAAKADATLLALKEQEDAGIDVVTDGEMSRQHFVHGFLEFVDGIDFAHKVEMGIRADRYKAMVPQVVGELRLKGRVHATEARLARAHTKAQAQDHHAGPMTIIDTIADRHYGDRVKMAMAFAALLNQEARALAADGVDVIQFDEPAFNVYMDEVADWGIEALHKAIEGVTCRTAVHICYGYGIKANVDWKATLGERMAAVREGVSGAGAEPDRPGLARMPQFQGADEPAQAARRQGRAGRRDRRRPRRGRDARAGRRGDRRGDEIRRQGEDHSVDQLRHGADAARSRGSASSTRSAPARRWRARSFG